MFEHLITARRQQLSRIDALRRVSTTALILLLLIIAVSPVTQSIWKGDNILDGHDTETTLILGLTLASGALLRMQRSRIDIDGILKRIRDFASSFFGAWLLWYLTRTGQYSCPPVSITQSRGRPGKHTGYQLPLLI